MASATIHQTETSSFISAKSAVICDVCRKHVDLPTQCAEACGDESPSEPIQQHPSTIKLHKDAHHFDCNICLDGCQDPVVTHCGHLFCWPCLYYWLSLPSVSKECPVCKASVQDKIIPLYGLGKAEHSVNSAAIMFPDMHIPCRPLPSRSDAPVAATDHSGGEHIHVIGDYESHSSTMGGRHASIFFASMLRCGMISLPAYGGGASIPATRQRYSNEKEFVLHWAFIFVACMAIVYFIVCC